MGNARTADYAEKEASSMATSDDETNRYRLDARRLRLDFRKQEDERRKLDVEERKIENERIKASFDASIRFAEHTLRSLILLNGGAAVSLITFASKESSIVGTKISAHASTTFTGAVVFAVGAAMAVLSMAVSYLAQHQYTYEILEKRVRWTGNAFRATAIVLAIGSMGLFIYGVYSAYSTTLTGR